MDTPNCNDGVNVDVIEPDVEPNVELLIVVTCRLCFYFV